MEMKQNESEYFLGYILLLWFISKPEKQKVLMKKFIKLSQDNNIYIMRGERERRHTNKVGEQRILVSEVCS